MEDLIQQALAMRDARVVALRDTNVRDAINALQGLEGSVNVLQADQRVLISNAVAAVSRFYALLYGTYAFPHEFWNSPAGRLVSRAHHLLYGVDLVDVTSACMILFMGLDPDTMGYQEWYDLRSKVPNRHRVRLNDLANPVVTAKGLRDHEGVLVPLVMRYAGASGGRYRKDELIALRDQLAKESRDGKATIKIK